MSDEEDLFLYYRFVSDLSGLLQEYGFQIHNIVLREGCKFGNDGGFFSIERIKEDEQD